MRRLLRRLLPQRYRLRLWLLREYFAPDSFRLRRAQPSWRRRLVARIVLARGAGRDGVRPSGVERLSAVRVINLASRPDRLAAFIAEMRKLEIEDVDRFDAIPEENGALGCALSHAEVARQLLTNGWDSMMVCEDDVEFLVDRKRLDVLVDAFLDDRDADVACLSYFVRRSRPHNRLFLRGTNVQTASCYLIKRGVVEELLAVWEDGIEHLARGETPHRYACDRSWLRLQESRVFLVPIVRAARQRSGYSDIERRTVSYTH
jgi:glycosyl transferase family 25